MEVAGDVVTSSSVPLNIEYKGESDVGLSLYKLPQITGLVFDRLNDSQPLDVQHIPSSASRIDPRVEPCRRIQDLSRHWRKNQEGICDQQYIRAWISNAQTTQ